MTTPEHSQPPTPTRAALPVLLMLVVLNVIGFGVVVPLLPFFASAFDAQPWQVALMFAAYSAGQFGGELFWGPISDRTGRRPILLITTLGVALGSLALAFSPSIWIAVLSRLVAGFFAGNLSVIQSYIVDISPPERLAARLGYIGSSFAMGFVVGPALGGLLAHPEHGTAGFQPPLLLAAALAAVAALGMMLFVPESRTGLHVGARPHPFVALGEAMVHPVLRPTLAAQFLSFFAFSGLWSVLGLWGDARFGWTAREFGLVMVLTGVSATLSQGLLSVILIRRIGAGTTIAVSLAMAGAWFLAMAIAPWAWLAIIGLSLAVVGHVASHPAAASLVSHSAPPERQGEVLGAASAVSSLARMFGPVMGGVLYSLVGPEAPIIFTGLAMFPAAWMGWRASRALRTAREL